MPADGGAWKQLGPYLDATPGLIAYGETSVAVGSSGRVHVLWTQYAPYPAYGPNVLMAASSDTTTSRSTLAAPPTNQRRRASAQ